MEPAIACYSAELAGIRAELCVVASTDIRIVQTGYTAMIARIVSYLSNIHRTGPTAPQRGLKGQEPGHHEGPRSVLEEERAVGQRVSKGATKVKRLQQVKEETCARLDGARQKGGRQGTKESDQQGRQTGGREPTRLITRPVPRISQ